MKTISVLIVALGLCSCSTTSGPDSFDEALAAFMLKEMEVKE